MLSLLQIELDAYKRKNKEHLHRDRLNCHFEATWISGIAPCAGIRPLRVDLNPPQCSNFISLHPELVMELRLRF